MSEPGMLYDVLISAGGVDIAMGGIDTARTLENERHENKGIQANHG